MPDYVGAEAAPAPGTASLHGSRNGAGRELTSQLLAALIALEDRDRQLITALFTTASPAEATPGESA